jgi:hypothetical protein
VNVFIGMEESQTIQRAFEERGHNSWSCDFKPGALNPSRHIQGNVHEVLRRLTWTPDLIILHPVCRFLTVSGQHWTGKPGQRTVADRDQAVEDFMACTEYGPRVCIENPIGIMSTRWRKPDQIIQPYEFGDDASKFTCFWLINLPILLPTTYFPPRMVNGKPRWGNQTDSGQNRLGPTKDPEDRRASRAKTYPGPANAMADQWGTLAAHSPAPNAPQEGM